jgi:hypothetical protein
VELLQGCLFNLVLGVDNVRSLSNYRFCIICNNIISLVRTCEYMLVNRLRALYF